MNTKRPHQITFRLSDDERVALSNQISSSGCTQQEYLRRAALGKDITSTDGLKAILPEMKRQGVNLNQIARRLNERGYVDYDNTLSGVLQEVEETWRSLRRFLHTLQ